jgi:hypothetical protein
MCIAKPFAFALCVSYCLLCSACSNQPVALPTETPTVTIPYDSLKAEIKQVQLATRQKYNDGDAAMQDSLVKATQVYLLDVIHQSVFTRWYNTPWEFYGMTQKPQQGTIACGYFVTTVLQDAGFNVPRIKWAQLPSESMIKKLNPTLTRFSNKSIDDFEAYFTNKPDGLYIVGLDVHVGFVSKYKGKLQFIHSSYYQPSIGVLAEPLKGHNPLNDSKYRVLAEILHPDMIQHWITGQKYE